MFRSNSLIPALILLSFVSTSLGAENFRGYLVYDEEWVGFYPCGGGEPYGINYEGELDVRSIYQSHKTYVREPIYFEVVAELSDRGDYGYGLVPEPANSYLLITQVIKIERQETMGCGAKTGIREIKEVIREP